LSSKNNNQNINTTNKNSVRNVETTSNNKTGNKVTNSQNNSMGKVNDYVSGDSARSSSSHQFHRNASDKS
jgi:hypothetical protein